MERKLASIQKVVQIDAIPDADKVECVKVLGWACVAKKGEFKVGDLVIYIEIDSLIPKDIWSGFLFKEGTTIERYRLKTVKMRGQVSQGLVLPVTVLYNCISPTIKTLEEGDDVTSLMKIEKYEPPEDGDLNGNIKGSFPSFIHKTDETRIQTAPWILTAQKGKKVYVTEKVDGSSATFYVKDGKFGVCSRNMEMAEQDFNAFWQIARKYDIEKKLRSGSTMFGPADRNWAIQGELLGPKVNGNKYGLTEFLFKAFNMYDIDHQCNLHYAEFLSFTQTLDIPTVPQLGVEELGDATVEQWVERSKGRSILADVPREGIVVRGIYEEDIYRYGKFSFKAINPDFLIKYKGD